MRQIFVVFLLLVTYGCTAKPEVISYDFSARTGVYILGFTTDEDIRRAIENQLVADLQARDMVAYPSYVDLPSLPRTNRDAVLKAANARQALAVLVINQVIPGEDGVIDNPLRITTEHPDLASFYEFTKSVERNFDPDKVVFAEVNAFLIEGTKTRLVWSGTTWSFNADGEGGAISGMSGNIADELGQIRDALLGR